MSIAWQHDCVELLRVLIGDMNEVPNYTDERLERVLLASAHLLVKEASFTQNFVVDMSMQSITPDPTDRVNQTNDEDFVNLMCVKAACIIDTGSAILAAQNAISIKDMVFSADLRGTSESTLALLKAGWCKTYDQLLSDYIYSGNIACAAVMGPFRTIAFRYGRPDNSYFGSSQRSY